MKVTRSAGGVVLNHRGQVLVVNQRGRSWSLPKGHIEEGEEPLAAAQREIYEESGVQDLQLIRFLGNYQRAKIGFHGGESEDELKDLTFYLFHALKDQELKPIDPDNPEARWVEKNEVASLLTHPKDRDFFLKILYEL